MNCFVEINEESFPGNLISHQGNIFNVQMAGQEGYDYVVEQMNCPARILISQTGMAYDITTIVSLVPQTLSISFR